MLIFGEEDMASFLANQNFPFWSSSKSCIYEAKFLERKKAQIYKNKAGSKIISDESRCSEKNLKHKKSVLYRKK